VFVFCPCSDIDGNSFGLLTSYSLTNGPTGVFVDTTATHTRIAGNQMGFDSTGSDRPLYCFVNDRGQNTIIGIDPATSALSACQNQRNIFTSAGNCAILSNSAVASGSIVAGNWFGYNTTGASLVPYSPPGCSIIVISSFPPMIQSNWFGCGVLNLGSGSTQISGNYFGFASTGNPSSTSYLDANTCGPQVRYILSSGSTVIGWFYFHLSLAFDLCKHIIILLFKAQQLLLRFTLHQRTTL